MDARAHTGGRKNTVKVARSLRQHFAFAALATASLVAAGSAGFAIGASRQKIQDERISQAKATAASQSASRKIATVQEQLQAQKAEYEQTIQDAVSLNREILAYYGVEPEPNGKGQRTTQAIEFATRPRLASK